LDFAETRDIDEFVEMLARFERGEITADAWRTFRLLRGTYGQRQDEAAQPSMLRAKIPQGVLTAAQLESLADVAERHSRGFCHITTRQNIQLHFVPLAQMGEAMHTLAASGITTREACGNSVRNVTTSATAGVAADEAFDPTPYARAFTRYFLRHPLSSSLPRKFKVAFSGGGEDHANVLINDLGFTARLRDGERGFRVTAGGGTALMCVSARELVDFVPAADILGVAEAVVRVFHARGDREHRKKNRMKFLIKQLGWDVFRTLVRTELEALEQSPVLTLDEEHEESPPQNRAPSPRPAEIEALVADDVLRGPGIHPRFLPVAGDPRSERFFRTNVRAQKQDGFSWVTVVVPLGDLSSGRLRALAALARSYADGTVRTTATQNVVLRWVPSDRVAQLHAHLERIGLAEPDPDSIADVSSCPGAESCKLAVTQSRGLADALGERFREDRTFIDRAPGLTIRVSGCPNGCGLHHVATIGFQGGLRKVGGRAAPQYFVYAGGDAGSNPARFGRVIGKVPARRIVTVVERLIAKFEQSRNDGERIADYLARAPTAELTAAIADLVELDEARAHEEDFVDLGETTAFRPETTEGECAA
jgi:sulfite reductase (NADPH) hemoprotein beta-component